MSGESLPLWVEGVVSSLLIASGVFVVIAAIGFQRFDDFFVRMHSAALAYTGGAWSVTLAGIVYFTARESRLTLQPVLIIILLFITVPATSVLLARVVLFRRRVAAVADTPPPLTPLPRR